MRILAVYIYFVSYIIDPQSNYNTTCMRHFGIYYDVVTPALLTYKPRVLDLILQFPPCLKTNSIPTLPTLRTTSTHPRRRSLVLLVVLVHAPANTPSDLHAILKATKVGMLTTRSAEGSLHSRAMTPASRTASFRLLFRYPDPPTSLHRLSADTCFPGQ